MSKTAAILLAIFVAGTAAAQGVPGHANVSPPAAPSVLLPASTAHLQALTDMLRSMHADEIVRATLEQALADARQKSPGSAALMNDALASQPYDFMLKDMVQVYARYFTQAEADTATRFYATPVGKKFVIAMLRTIPALKARYPVPPNFSPLEEVQGQAFLRSPVGAKLAHFPPGMQLELNAAMRATGQRMMAAQVSNDMAPLKRELEASLQPGTSAAVAGAATAGNQNPIALMARAAAESARLYREASARYERELTEVMPADMMAPAKLVVPADIAESRRRLQQAGEALDRYLQEDDRIRAGMRSQIVALPVSEEERAGMLRGFERGQQRSIERSIRIGENQRALLSIYLQILNLMDGVQGKVKLQDGRLLFDDEADRAQFAQLLQRLREESDKETALRAESMDQMRTTAQNLK